MPPNDPPEIVTLPDDAGYVLVSPAEIVPAAPAPLASIRDRVARDWIDEPGDAAGQGGGCGRSPPRRRAACRSRRPSGKPASPLPPVRPLAARRIQIADGQATVPPALQDPVHARPGKSRMAPDPQGRGFFVVKVDKIMPGNALLQPNLISQMQNELQQSASRRITRGSSSPRCART